MSLRQIAGSVGEKQSGYLEQRQRATARQQLHVTKLERMTITSDTFYWRRVVFNAVHTAIFWSTFNRKDTLLQCSNHNKTSYSYSLPLKLLINYNWCKIFGISNVILQKCSMVNSVFVMRISNNLKNITNKTV